MPAFSPSLVDDCNRADQTGGGTSSPDGAAWTDKVKSSDNGIAIGGNTIKAANNVDGTGYLGTNRGPTLQIAAKLAVAPAIANELLGFFARITGEGGATPTAYRIGAQIDAGGVHQFLVTEIIAGSFSTLTPVAGSAAVSPNWANGDLIGATLVETGSGTLITVYRNQGSGWVAVCSYFSTAGSRPTGAGKIGVNVTGNGTTLKIDDIYATTISAIPSTAAVTRHYLEDSTVAPPISPSAASSWNKTSVMERRVLTTRKLGTAIATKTYAMLGTNPSDTAARQCITAPLAAQTIHGHFKGIIRAAEGASTNNYAPQAVVYVTDSAGTLLKTLVAAQTEGATAGPPEFATSLTNRKFPRSWATPGSPMDPYECAAGCYVVVELGAGQQSTATANAQLSLGSNAGTDLAENETGTTANDPWVEFLLGLEYLPRTASGIQVVTAQAIARAALR